MTAIQFPSTIKSISDATNQLNLPRSTRASPSLALPVVLKERSHGLPAVNGAGSTRESSLTVDYDRMFRDGQSGASCPPLFLAPMEKLGDSRFRQAIAGTEIVPF